jgi:hypothetical protein
LGLELLVDALELLYLFALVLELLLEGLEFLCVFFGLFVDYFGYYSFIFLELVVLLLQEGDESVIVL